MRLLGIDFGKSKIGLAVGDTGSKLAEPLKVIRGFRDIGVAIEKVARVIEVEEIGKIVIGLSGGKVDDEVREFGSKLSKVTGVDVEYHDEGYSTKEAQMKSLEAGVKQKKRKEMEDAYAASLILQGYMDSVC